MTLMTGTTVTTSSEQTDTIVYFYTLPPYYSKSNIIEGSLTEDGKIGAGNIMFSSAIKDLYEDDEQYLGQTLTVEFSNLISTITNISKDTISPEVLTLSGIVDTSVMSSMLIAYIDYDYLQEIICKYDETFTLKPTILYILTQSEEDCDKVNAYIKNNTNGKYTGSVEDQLASMFQNMLSVIGTALIVIAGISLLVSAIMILVVMYMSVTERTKEIGVLKSIGARRKDIKAIFSSESLLVGLLSGIVGIILALILIAIIALVLTSITGFIPLSFRWWYFALAIGISVVISMLSGLYPASKAGKLDPVESLRHD